MIAGLPMYDWPEVRADTDALWAAIRDALRGEGLAAPETLDRRTPPMRLWTDRRLVLGQTCGLPYRRALIGRVAMIGPFDFALPDAPPGFYFSEIVAAADAAIARIDDLDGTRLALNGFDSQSGWAAIATEAAARGLRFERLLVTGAHLASAEAVAAGRADAAALDAVSWRLIERHRPGLAARLKVIGRTPPTPGLPLIAAAGSDSEATARAVARGIARAGAGLGIRGLVTMTAADYADAIPEPPAPAAVVAGR